MATAALANIASIRAVVVWLVVNTTTEQTSINVHFPSSPPVGLEGVRLIGKDHPGYFGKVGMRYFHERKVQSVLMRWNS